jgi:hypothetical protein
VCDDDVAQLTQGHLSTQRRHCVDTGKMGWGWGCVGVGGRSQGRQEDRAVSGDGMGSGACSGIDCSWCAMRGTVHINWRPEAAGQGVVLLLQVLCACQCML